MIWATCAAIHFVLSLAWLLGINLNSVDRIKARLVISIYSFVIPLHVAGWRRGTEGGCWKMVSSSRHKWEKDFYLVSIVANHLSLARRSFARRFAKLWNWIDIVCRFVYGIATLLSQFATTTTITVIMISRSSSRGESSRTSDENPNARNPRHTDYSTLLIRNICSNRFA